jgi:hypothetical protein
MQSGVCVRGERLPLVSDLKLVFHISHCDMVLKHYAKNSIVAGKINRSK